MCKSYGLSHHKTSEMTKKSHEFLHEIVKSLHVVQIFNNKLLHGILSNKHLQLCGGNMVFSLLKPCFFSSRKVLIYLTYRFHSC